MMLQLHDNFNFSKMSTAKNLELWPPISWNKFKPTTYAAIETHYYNFSPGCQNTLLGKVLEGFTYVVGAVATFFTAGIAAPLAAAASGAVAGVSTALGQLVKQSIENATEQAIQNGMNSATASMMATGRKRIDYGAEVDRIRRTYTVNYNTFANLTYLEQYTKSQLENKLQNFKSAFATSISKCDKRPCDTAGCRDAGILFLRVQYVELLLNAYAATNTTTPAEYNNFISTEFYKLIPKQDLETIIVDEEKKKEETIIVNEKKKKQAYISALLIIGALFSGLLKKP
jgi:hypothetical protein